MDLIHDRLLNNQFAPGIATYGIDGKDGEAGPAGTSFYFTSYSLENESQRDDCIVKINRNMVLSEFADIVLDRKYVIGDLVLDAIGKIYKIVQKNGQLSLDYVSNIIGSDSSTMFKTSSNNRVYLDSSYDGLDIIQGTENNSYILDTTSTDSILRVVSTKEDTKTGKFNILQLLAKPALDDSKYLNVTYDKASSSFVIESNSDIVIDSSLVEVKSDNSRSTTSLGDYYKITPYNDPIGLVHMMLSESSWEVSENILTISDIDITHIESLGLSARFTVKIQYSNGNVVMNDYSCSTDDNLIGYISIPIEDSDISSVSVIRGIEVFIKKS